METNETTRPTEILAQPPVLKKRRSNLFLIILGLVVVIGGGIIYLFWKPDLSGEMVIPFLGHQRPLVDPHLPSSNQLADKLDEVSFDGLFNISANPSGVLYEDGLGELVGIDNNNVVTVRLRTGKRWHDSFHIERADDQFIMSPATPHPFSAADLNFTLQRIQRLRSLSPDYILVSQALDPMGFEGPDENNLIRFQFKGDRIWTEADIKEVLSFKIIPANADVNALTYTVGTGPYIVLPPVEGVSNFHRDPNGVANIGDVLLKPFVDNSTYTTEMNNGKINILLETPFGSLSSILDDREDYFVKSNVSTTFFALFLNVQRLNREQRKQVRALISPRAVVGRFFKENTEQARHIVDYKGNTDNYGDYVNHSIFPSTSYYVEENVLDPVPQEPFQANLAILPDTIKIRASMNFGFREEYAELIDILNDPVITQNRVRALAVSNEEIRKGEYDGLLVAISGYRSNFLFDLYNIFFREPDPETYRINLQTTIDEAGAAAIDRSSFRADKNFFRIDAQESGPEQADVDLLLQYIYGFMSTRQIGDKQEYARRVDQLEHEMCLGVWLFSVPSLAYFSTQFDSASVDLYGVASQLSTIEKWKERADK
ncbi:MAG: hypothetical protein OEM41_08795 [Ignavibacteria bacterium]|nr:hypothetical protein [Ignavibacteria bacterium]